MEVIGCLMAVAALAVGLFAGIAVQHKRQAVKAHVTAKEAMPGLKRTARSARLKEFLWFVAIGVFLVTLALIVRGTSGG